MPDHRQIGLGNNLEFINSFKAVSDEERSGRGGDIDLCFIRYCVILLISTTSFACYWAAILYFSCDKDPGYRAILTLDPG